MATTIEIRKADITAIDTEAIVNAANTTLLGGGGVDGAIHRAAGPRLLQACAQLGGCLTGQAKLTRGFCLPAQFVIHTVGPVWHGGAQEEARLLGDCYRNSLELARQHNIRSIAFPSISTGAYRFPIEQAASIALRAVRSYLEGHPGSFDRIVFVLFSDQDLLFYEQAYPAVFDKERP